MFRPVCVSFRRIGCSLLFFIVRGENNTNEMGGRLSCLETLRRASAAASSTWHERIDDTKVSRELRCRNIAEEMQTFTSWQKAARKGVTAAGFQGVREYFLKKWCVISAE